MAEHGDALLRWCKRAGIDTAYHDTWGHRHEASEAGLRALLAELGITDPSAQALAAAQESDWRESAPLVQAVPADAPRVELVVRVPQDLRRLRWTLRQEGGAQHAGAVDAAECAVEAQATVDGRSMHAL